nr:RelA/SpoT domain-containing protein [Caulobacter sp. S45]
MQIDLRRKVRHVEAEVTVAQRIKRIESIHRKLVYKDTMRLVQMQDIGGCRAVLSSINSLQNMRDRYDKSIFAHTLHKVNDYMNEPKPDGYRSLRLVYSFKGKDKTACYDGLRIEVQLRTELQHAWATAVETVDLFTKQAIKSNRGERDWRRFFALMSAAIASIEGCVTVEGTPQNRDEPVSEIRELSDLLRVKNTLGAYKATLEGVRDMREYKFFVLRLDIKNQNVRLQSFGPKQSRTANLWRDRIESELVEEDDVQVVLLSVDSLSALYRAYPNYFADTSRFVSLLDQAVKGDFPRPICPA